MKALNRAVMRFMMRPNGRAMAPMTRWIRRSIPRNVRIASTAATMPKASARAKATAPLPRSATFMTNSKNAEAAENRLWIRE